MISEWGKFEDKIETCDFGPKTVCYNPQNRAKSAFRTVTHKPHMIFDFRKFKEGLYIIVYEWEKYEVKIKTCVFGPKTVYYKPTTSREIDIFKFFFLIFNFIFFSFSTLIMIMNIV